VIEDVFAVQDEIAGAVGKALNVTLLGRPSTKVVRNSKAYALILQGQHLAYQNSEESLKESVNSLEQALEVDPDNPDALATRETLASARQAAERAIAQDDTTFKAHIHLGWLHVMHCEWSQGAHEAQRAEELAPGAADVLFLRASLLAVQDRLPDAVKLLQRAKELEPLSAVYFFHCGRMLWWSGQLAEARTDIQKVLALSPGFTSARACLGLVELMATAATSTGAWPLCTTPCTTNANPTWLWPV
jgi:tetratricopeptide (TPR) repeat protein